MHLTVSQFRQKIREALNAAEAGQSVYIERYGTYFQVIKQPSNFSIDENGAKITITPENYRKQWNEQAKNKLNVPQIPEKNTPDLPSAKTQDGFTEAGTQEQPCCNLKKPCKHWSYNDQMSVWVNSLSGREKEVEQ